MLTIADKSVIHQESIVLPDKEIARFHVNEKSWNFSVEVQFHPEIKDELKKISWTFKNAILHIDFNGLDQSLGVAPVSAIKLGVSGMNEALGFLFFHHKAGVMNKLDIIFLSGGVYV